MQVIHKTFYELITSLRKWFNSVCSCTCDGYNNLFSPELTCIDEQTGIVTSKVHHDDLSSAEELINLARTDIQSRNPPVVHLSQGWILCLSIHNNSTATDMSSSSNNNSNISLGLWMLIVVCVASLCTILALLLFITTAIIYINHKR